MPLALVAQEGAKERTLSSSSALIKPEEGANTTCSGLPDRSSLDTINRSLPVSLCLIPYTPSSLSHPQGKPTFKGFSYSCFLAQREEIPLCGGHE